MNSISDLKRSVLEYVERYALAGAGAAIVAEFPGQGRGAPLKKPAVAVGVEQMELKDGGFGGFYGDGAQGGVYGKTMEVQLYFDIHCPYETGAAECHALYEKLCDTLLLTGCPFGFYRMWCGAVTYNQHTGGTQLRVGAALKAAATHREESLRVREFEIRSEQSI